MISVALLGPVEVRRDGELIAVPSGKPTELLMRLAVAAGTMVPKDQLLEDLWADDAVSTTANTMQSKVSRLRRALGDPGLIEGGPIGYRLVVDSSSVDLLDLARRADEVSSLIDAGDAAGVRDACTAALALFRGATLFGASDADWVLPHRAQAEGLRLRLLEDQLRARVELGASGEVVDDLEELVTEHPLREGLWALLITALYRAGRQADALAAYRTVREHLVEELGIEPGPDLQRLEGQVLAQDPALTAPAPTRRAVTVPAMTGNLPALSSSIVGRDRQCAELAELCARHRLVTLVGPAGVGKTRLALEVAEQRQPDDGSWLVRLETARSPDAVADTIATDLHANDGTEASLIERLRGADVLLVLDNCEHLVDRVAELVEPLLRAGPAVRLLATSQVPLGVDGEQVYAVDPLSADEAVELFTRRAALDDTAVGNDDSTTIEEVCRALDGLPLAIELAAARTRSLSLSEISRRLEDRFNLLRDPSSRRPDRQRALSSAIAWSYDLLFPDDQRGLWALAVFVGGAPLDGFEQVLGALDVPADVAADVVGRLVDRSLVRIERQDDGDLRYWLLDSVRRYALDRLLESGNGDLARAAHARWVATKAAAAFDGVRGGDQPAHVAFARTERANVDGALDWAVAADPVLALTIAGDLGWAWMLAGDPLGVQRIRTSLTAAGPTAPDDLRVGALLLLGWLHAAAGDVDLACAAVLDAIDELGDTEDGYARARADLFLAYVRSQRGEFRDAQDLLDRSRSAFEDLGRSWDEAVTWVLTAHVSLAGGDRSKAIECCDHASTLLEQVRDPWLIVHTEAMLGAIAQAEQRYGDACEHLERAAVSAHDQGFASAEAYHLANLGRAQHQTGDLDSAANTLQRSVDTARATGDLRIASLARLRLARVLRSQGDTDAAWTCAREAQDWYRASGGGDHSRLADCVVASMTVPSEDATTVLEAILDDARRAADPEVEVLALDALAHRAAATGDVDAAASFLAAADDAMPAARLRVTDADRIDALAARQLLERVDLTPR